MPVYTGGSIYWKSYKLEYYTQSLRSSDDMLITAAVASSTSLELYRLIWCSRSFRITWIPQIFLSFGLYNLHKTYVDRSRHLRRLSLLRSARQVLIPSVHKAEPYLFHKEDPYLWCSTKRMVFTYPGRSLFSYSMWRMLIMCPGGSLFLYALRRMLSCYIRVMDLYILPHSLRRTHIWYYVVRNGSSFAMFREAKPYCYASRWIFMLSAPREGRLFLMNHEVDRYL